MKINEVLRPKVPRARRDVVTIPDKGHEEDQEQRDDKPDLGYPKGEFDLRKLTRNPDRRGARVPPVHSDRPPRGPVHNPQRNV